MPDQHDLFSPDDFVEVPDQTETVEDIDGLDQRTVSQAVVSGADWTTETVISQINKGNIQLNPRFQRRDAWESDRKSRFIESLIIGLPLPQLVLAEAKNKRGSYIVIDGKQRLLSIRQFAAEYVRETSFGPNGYLKQLGLVASPDAARVRASKIATTLTPLNPGALR